MTPETAAEQMHTIQASQRPWLNVLVRRLLLTYALPLGGALLLATVGAVLLSQIIPSSTATAIVFALNVGLFYYGWNYMEKRTRATVLFTLYVSGTRERRTLAALIQNAQTPAAALSAQVERYAQSAQAFISAAG